MKRTLFLTFALFIYLLSFSQTEDNNESFFKKDNLFTGGTGNFSFGDNITSVGLSPFFGYSLNKY